MVSLILRCVLIRLRSEVVIFNPNLISLIFIFCNCSFYTDFVTIPETEKLKYEACVGVASTLLAPAQLRMAKLAVSMHITSPAVRMFDEIAIQVGAKDAPCDTFVAIASQKVCDNDILRDVLKAFQTYSPVGVLFISGLFQISVIT